MPVRNSEPCLFPNLAPITSYNNGCRCIGCRDGIAEFWRNKKRKQREQERLEAEQMVILAHGTKTAFNSGCRCSLCKSYNKRISARGKRRDDN
jgi:hypothetical protein